VGGKETAKKPDLLRKGRKLANRGREGGLEGKKGPQLSTKRKDWVSAKKKGSSRRGERVSVVGANRMSPCLRLMKGLDQSAKRERMSRRRKRPGRTAIEDILLPSWNIRGQAGPKNCRRRGRGLD